MGESRWAGALVGSFLLSLVSVAATRAVTLQGLEFQVNLFTPNRQQNPAVARDADGDFVVVWESYSQDGDAYGIFARRFNSSGTAQGLEFQVNLYTPSFESRPTVGLAAGGDFVIVWLGLTGVQNADARGVGGVVTPSILARRFNAGGAAQGGELVVGGGPLVGAPSVGADAAGGFVVAWPSLGGDAAGTGIIARRFDSGGNGAGYIPVNQITTGDQQYPSVGVGPIGDFVVAWESPVDGDTVGVSARRFNSTGVPLTAELQVNVYTPASQRRPKVDGSDNGDFVVTWSSGVDFQGNNDVFARQFNSAGAAQSGDLMVHQYTTGNQIGPDVAVDAGGAFVVTWVSDLQIRARAFDAYGSPRGAEVRIDSFAGTKSGTAVDVDGQGRFVAAWASYNQDGSNYAVIARRLIPPIVLDVDGDGVVSALTDTLLALRYAFGFRDGTLVTGAVGAGCTRCTAAQIEAYLAGLM